MTCNHCGLEIGENEKFCPRCGAPAGSPPPASGYSPAPVPAGPAAKGKNRAAFLWAAAAAALAVLLLLQNLGLVGLIAGSGTKNHENKSSVRAQVEGAGYDSAEEAVEAYIDALCEGDVAAMLSTFAVETYIDSYDTKAGLSFVGAWLPATVSDGSYEIIGSDYERQLRCLERQAYLSQRLHGQLLTYSAFFGNGIDSFDIGAPVPFEKESDVEAFLDAYRESAFGKMLPEMKLTGFADPAALSEPYGSEANQKHLQKRRDILGCDEYKSIAARVALNGEDWLLTMDCASYQGRWYNINPAGNLANLLGILVEQWGLTPWPETN